jgi:hypothetical protein
MAAETSDSVGGFLLTGTDTVVVALGVPPVVEYLIFTVTDGICCSPSRLQKRITEFISPENSPTLPHETQIEVRAVSIVAHHMMRDSA